MPLFIDFRVDLCFGIGIALFGARGLAPFANDLYAIYFVIIGKWILIHNSHFIEE